MAPSKHALLGPSSSARWLACPPSARLTEFMPNETSVYAEEGTKAHYLCEQVVRRSIPGWEGLPEAPMQDLWSNDDYTPEMKEAAKLYADFIHILYAEFKHTPTVCVEQHVKMTRWVPESSEPATACLSVTESSMWWISSTAQASRSARRKTLR